MVSVHSLLPPVFISMHSYILNKIKNKNKKRVAKAFSV
uniref:Uncharacterized protein n=1 Tax=Anguilla anguilla TaxID=7936 RepID=A0A0E9SR24_ANGAN